MIELRHLMLLPFVIRPLARLAPPLLHDAMPVFMMHRFAHPDLGVRGVSASFLRTSLQYLRREGYRLVSLADLAVAPEKVRGRGVPVAFTVDDGYTDFRDIALPVFAEFDCPVTVFVSTGVIDRTSWYWWDSLRLMFERSARRHFTLTVNDKQVTGDLSNPVERERQLMSLIERFKTVREDERIASFDQISNELEVELPATRPPRYATMTWSQIRECAAGGLANFGPHTISHASLPMTSDAQARQEIVGSWARLREQCPSATPVFCYPFGAYTDREVGILRETDMVGALTTEPAYASRTPFSEAGNSGRFEVPRFGYPNDVMDFRQLAIGVERVKMAVRNGRAGWQARPANGMPHLPRASHAVPLG